MFFACNDGKLTPTDAEQQACECMKLSKDNSEEGLQAFKDCNTKTTEMISEYKSDPEWMGKWREELMSVSWLPNSVAESLYEKIHRPASRQL